MRTRTELPVRVGGLTIVVLGPLNGRVILENTNLALAGTECVLV